MFGLSAGAWPVEWGGWPELISDKGDLMASLAPGWDTLDLVADPHLPSVPMVRRAVELRFVIGRMSAEAGC
jgi:hypothetical protein